jgi:hypothetical protein
VDSGPSRLPARSLLDGPDRVRLGQRSSHAICASNVNSARCGSPGLGDAHNMYVHKGQLKLRRLC